jgi:hypothetical protein
VGIFTWGLYLWGDQTNLTIAGPTLICELMVWDGKVALVGTPGTYDAATTATTIEVGAPGRDSAAELTLRNAAIGRFAPGDPVTGQVTARGRARITIDHARTANLVLITKDSGAISLSDIERTGEIKVIADGGPVVLPHDAAPAAH